MSKHDDDFGTALPRLPQQRPTQQRPMAITPFRAVPTIVARPAMAVPARPAVRPMPTSPVYAIPARPVLRSGPTNPVMDAITSPSGREAAVKAAILVNNPRIVPSDIMQQTPAALASQAFGPSPSESFSPLPSGAMADGGGGSGASDDGGQQSVDWSMLNDSSPVSAGTPAKALAIVAPSEALPAAPVKESFWSKLLALFGFGKKQLATPTVHGEHDGPNTTRGMVESVVRRARNGDQNAMALIALVRDNAKQGHGKAQETFALLQEYVRTHPVGSGNNPRIVSSQVQGPLIRIGGEFPDAVALSHGPTLTNGRIEEMLSRFSGEQQDAIRFGMANKDSAASRNPVVRIGKILGHARRLQAVRMRDSSLHKFDPRVAAELDE